MHLALLALLISAPAAQPPTTDLPPIDLLRGLRGARIAHQQGDHGRELETLRQAFEAFPEQMSALHALLIHYRDHEISSQETQRLQGTLSAMLADPASRPPAAVLGLMISDREADQGNLRQIADHLERRTAGSAAEVELLELLTYVYDRLDDTAGSIETFEKLIAIEPTNLRKWHLLESYRNAERWQDALDLVSRWLEEQENPYGLRATYINLLSRIGRHEEVMKQVDLLLADRQAFREQLAGQGIESENLWHTSGTRLLGLGVVRNAAWNLRDAGQDEAAETLFRKVAEFNPKDQGVRKALLYLYGSEQELRDLQAESDARWRDEQDPNALFSEGTQRLTAGDASSAFELLQRAAPGLPHLEAVWYNLGMAAYRLERWQTVAEAFAKAGELNPERGQSFFYRGLALEKLGQCGDAVVALEKALALEPDRHLAHYYLATCYQWLGRMDKSKHHRALYDAATSS